MPDVRIKVKLLCGKTRMAWATQLSEITYRVLTRYGEPTDEYIFAIGDDIISKNTATLNKHYGLMEVISQSKEDK